MINHSRQMDDTAGDYDSDDMREQLGNIALNGPQVDPLVSSLLQQVSFRGKVLDVIRDLCGIEGKTDTREIGLALSQLTLCKQL